MKIELFVDGERLRVLETEIESTIHGTYVTVKGAALGRRSPEIKIDSQTGDLQCDCECHKPRDGAA